MNKDAIFECNSFAKLETCPFISVGKCNVNAQGIYNTYHVIAIGTGFNKYLFYLTESNTKESNDNKQKQSYTFETSDDYITAFQFRTCGDYSDSPDAKERTDEHFQAYGSLSLDNAQPVDFTHAELINNSFNIDSRMFTIEKIQVRVNAEKAIPKSCPTDSMQWCDEFMVPSYERIEKKIESLEK